VRAREQLIVMIERAGIGLASLVLSAIAIAAVSGYFSARDRPVVIDPRAGPGQVFHDLGNALLRPGRPRLAYDSNPPTSGPHQSVRVLGQNTELSDDQLLSALSLGDVVVMYGGSRSPPGLARLARTIAGPFSSSLAAARDAVILARKPGASGLIALAWTRMLRVSTPRDRRLRAFAPSVAWHGQHRPSLTPTGAPAFRRTDGEKGAPLAEDMGLRCGASALTARAQ